MTEYGLGYRHAGAEHPIQGCQWRATRDEARADLIAANIVLLGLDNPDADAGAFYVIERPAQ